MSYDQRQFDHVRLLTESAFVLLSLLLASKRAVDLFRILAGGVGWFGNTLLYLALFACAGLLIALNGWGTRVRLRYLLAIAGIVACAVISVSLNPQFGFSNDLKNILGSYSGLVLLCLVQAFGLRFRYPHVALSLGQVFISAQAALGVAQATMSSTIIPIVNSNGDPVVNTIYYANGISSTSSGLLELGGRVRAFGMTDSGLTLGMLLLLGCVLTQNVRSRGMRLALYVCYSYGIYLTYTRAVWICAAIFATIQLLRRVVPGLGGIWRNLYAISIAFQIGMILFIGAISALPVFEKFATLISRFEGFEYYLTALDFRPSRLAFGQNFTNYILEYRTYTAYTLDSDILVNIANIGVLGTGVLLLVYGSAIRLAQGGPSVRIFLGLYGVFGLFNATSYFFLVACYLFVMVNAPVAEGRYDDRGIRGRIRTERIFSD